MGLKEVKQEILDNAKKQASKITADGKAECKKISEIARRELNGAEDELKKQQERIVSDYKTKNTASLGFKIKRSRFNMEKRVLEKVMEATKEKLTKLDKDKRKEHIEYMIKDAKKTVSVDIVLCNQRDMGLVKEYECRKADIIGGIIVLNKDRTVRIDYSYDTMINDIFNKYLKEVSNILFGEDG
ncbi:hypothetical protein JW930_07225 [Candidatus Woesearchaeota archaeon]|nr:hypothetical protein [Candidatus Woesearchaeota archaeon]